MNSAGLSSICQGTNGLNGSALRAILSTFETGLVLALGLVPGVGDPVPVLVGAHALRSSPAMAAAMRGHRVIRANMNLSLQQKADAKIALSSRRPPPARVPAPAGASVRIIPVPRARWPLYRVPHTLVRR